MVRKFVILIAVLALALAACGGGGDDDSSGGDDGTAAAPPVSTATPDATHGEELFLGTCAACHGTDGKGITGLGKDFTTSTFADSLTDPELVAFIIEGRDASHPDNTTGVDMLPRGGNANLTDQDLFDIVAFVRTLYVG